MAEDKYIDEGWKESVAHEKEKLKSTPPGGNPQKGSEPEEQSGDSKPQEKTAAQTDPNFINYISSLAYQAMFFLGEIPNPADNQKEINLEQAKFVIDVLVTLRGKTEGNLSKQESDMINTAIYELQMKYVELTKKQAQAHS